MNENINEEITDANPSFNEKRIKLEMFLSAHASPRWKSADTWIEKQINNWALSIRRYFVVRKYLEKKFKEYLKKYHVDFEYETSSFDVRSAFRRYNISGQAMGSSQSKYGPNSDKLKDRRVDIEIDLSSLTLAISQYQIKKSKKVYSESRKWGIEFEKSFGLNFTKGIDAGVEAIHFRLTNLDSGKSMKGQFVVLKVGTDPASLLPIPSSPVSVGLDIPWGPMQIIETKHPKAFHHWHKKLVTGNDFSFKLLGFSIGRQKFVISGVGGAWGSTEDIDVDASGLGNTTDKIKLGASAKFGEIELFGKRYGDVNYKKVDVYPWKEDTDDLDSKNYYLAHSVFFTTQKGKYNETLSPFQKERLDKFIKGISKLYIKEEENSF